MINKMLKRHIANYFYDKIRIPKFIKTKNGFKFSRYKKDIAGIKRQKISDGNYKSKPIIKHHKGDIVYRHLKNTTEFDIYMTYFNYFGSLKNMSNHLTSHDFIDIMYKADINIKLKHARAGHKGQQILKQNNQSNNKNTNIHNQSNNVSQSQSDTTDSSQTQYDSFNN